MSEQQITIVRDSSSSSEVKVFVGGELRGRYKDDSTALAHLATALVELTAAQQRVAELEGCQAAAMLMREQQVESLKQRVAELEKICKLDGIEDLIATRDKLTADNARRKLEEELNMVYTTDKMAQDNARLRELLTKWREWIEYEYTARKNDESFYARGYRDGLDAADTQMDKLQAAIGEHD